MDATEKKVLKTISENLKKSTNVSWTYGNLDDFIVWSRLMKSNIISSCNIVDELLKDDEKLKDETQ